VGSTPTARGRAGRSNAIGCAAVATGMTDGMEWSYKNLDRTLAERQKG
jgi:hypothetical protein